MRMGLRALVTIMRVIVGRNVGDHFSNADAGIHEQHVEGSHCKTRSLPRPRS
jgi:hypothetical protein